MGGYEHSWLRRLHRTTETVLEKISRVRGRTIASVGPCSLFVSFLNSYLLTKKVDVRCQCSLKCCCDCFLSRPRGNIGDDVMRSIYDKLNFDENFLIPVHRCPH